LAWICRGAGGGGAVGGLFLVCLSSEHSGLAPVFGSQNREQSLFAVCHNRGMFWGGEVPRWLVLWVLCFYSGLRALPAVVLTHLVPRSKTLPPLPMACIRYYGVVPRDAGSWVRQSPLPRMQPPMHARSGGAKVRVTRHNHVWLTFIGRGMRVGCGRPRADMLRPGHRILTHKPLSSPRRKPHRSAGA
jgi:hypothetical protein